MNVELNWDEVRLGAYAGLAGYVDALEAGTAFNGGPPKLDDYVNDALSEWAVAKHLNVCQFGDNAARNLWKGIRVGVRPDGLAFAIEPNDAGADD
jgi:hypothetical protein